MSAAIGRLARVGRRQHGLWTRRQALDSGVTGDQIRRRLAAGDWVELRPEVYGAGSRPSDDVGRILSLCLELGPPIAMSGVAAAFVRQFPNISPPTALTAVVPLQRRVAVSGARVERSRRFPGVVPRINGVPVLGRVDTLITLADQVSHKALLDCVQELTRQGDIDLMDVAAALGRGRSGSAALRCVVTELGMGGDSRPERTLRQALRKGGVGGFEFGWELVLGDGVRYRPDLWNDALGFCVEVDGVASHSIASRMDSDRVRHNRLSLELGVAVARFTAGRIERAPADVVAEVRAAVAKRRTSLPVARGYVARRRPRRAP